MVGGIGWDMTRYGLLTTDTGMNLSQTTMRQVYDKYGLEATTRDFIGHSMALYTTDEYVDDKGMARDCIERIRLYVNSMARYGKSPYIYPLYGLGELPQGFARLSAIYGGTYMLNTNIDEVKYENGKVSGIRATMKERGEEGEGMKFETKCKKIIADPSYFPDKVRVTGHYLKAICILNHPVDKTDNSDSVQLILPQSQIGRKNGKNDPYTPSPDRTLIPSRHLHCCRLFQPQRLPQGLLHRHRLDRRRDERKPPPRAATWSRSPRPDRGAVHGSTNSDLRAHRERC